ncbi:hypothetical protein ACSBR2_037510 [Camellia fascicularis]
MEAVLLRTGSVPVQQHFIVPGSPKVSASPRISLVNSRSDSTPGKRTPRDSSESNVIPSDIKIKMGAYYREMLKSNPTNSLLLRNYGKFLHEVEGDMVKAEEYYGRAILASPGDGEVLCLYGKLIWDTQRDEDRANFYFDQAILASPNDCMVLGLYARFMWEAEEEEEEEEEKEDGGDG